ncbi:MAG: aerial mycelium formation protein [Kineosporiaceae bacterium]
MTEFLSGGRRRIDRVLDPAFLTGLAELELTDLRERRHEADQEEVDLSYARRLLQGRLDILRAEQASRRGDGPLSHGHPHSDAEIVAALKQILSDDGARAEPHGMGRHMGAEPSRVGETRREAERAVADVGGSDLTALSDVDLAQAVDNLAELEHKLSSTRRQVQSVMDRLTDEIARRYASGEVALPDLSEA